MKSVIRMLQRHSAVFPVLTRISVAKKAHLVARSSSTSFTTCWNCSQELTREQLFCDKKCGVLQAIKTTDINYFDLFGIPFSISVDMRALDGRFKDLQKQLHPDKFANKSMVERAASAETSSTVNQAYQTIKNPQLRMNYILARLGIEVLNETSGSYSNADLLVSLAILGPHHALSFHL